VNKPPQPQPPQQAALPGCWWHPNRQTGLSCARCERPACPDCLREAAVGFQCIDCVQTGQRQQRAQRKQYDDAGFGARTIAGARFSQRPIATPALVALNVLVYLVTAVQAQSPMDNQSSPLFQYGQLFAPSIGFDGEWWRLFTSGFLHYGLIHIAVNMLSLWIIGRDLEILLGKVRFLAVYFISMLGGSAAVYLFSDPGVPTVGASGAIYGLLGALLVAVLRLKLNPAMVIGTIVLNLAITYAIPGISLFAHVGGLVIGAVAMAGILFAPAKKREWWQTGALVVVLIALVGVVVIRDAQFGHLTCGYTAGNAIVCVDKGSS
jgi:membrane associated rhomboid family serine protease